VVALLYGAVLQVVEVRVPRLPHLKLAPQRVRVGAQLLRLGLRVHAVPQKERVARRRVAVQVEIESKV